MKILSKNEVSATPAATSQAMLAHVEERLALETDCWDVHATEKLEPRGFVLLDVRSKEMFQRGHLPGAVNLPHHHIDASRLADYAPETLFVTYCAGPPLQRGPSRRRRLAELGRPCKVMIGGIEGWKDEGFELVCGS